MSARQAAARFGIGISTAIRWIAREKIGERTPRPQGRRRASSLDAHEAFIVGLIEERKDITLNEMVEQLATERSARTTDRQAERVPDLHLRQRLAEAGHLRNRIGIASEASTSPQDHGSGGGEDRGVYPERKAGEVHAALIIPC